MRLMRKEYKSHFSLMRQRGRARHDAHCVTSRAFDAACRAYRLLMAHACAARRSYLPRQRRYDTPMPQRMLLDVRARCRRGAIVAHRRCPSHHRLDYRHRLR